MIKNRYSRNINSKNARGHYSEKVVRTLKPGHTISEVFYDDVEEVLWVVFPGGAMYAFEGVPENLYKGICTAESPTAFWRTNIKDQYEGRKCGDSERASVRGYAED